jgi:hypothetical protein
MNTSQCTTCNCEITTDKDGAAVSFLIKGGTALCQDCKAKWEKVIAVRKMGRVLG